MRLIKFDDDAFRNVYALSPSSSGVLHLRWKDTWDGATRDLDLILTNRNENESDWRSSTDSQMGRPRDDPYEKTKTALEEYDVLIAHSGGSEPEWIQLLAWGGTLSLNTPQTGSITSPSESANPGMLAVGAAHWSNPSLIETYSSRGPTPDGRVKPDGVAADCGETASRESAFCGTSQAAPHVAGMAALVRQRFPGYTPAQVVAYIEDNAEQRVRSPDPNNTWGHGFFVLPPLPVQASGVPSIRLVTPGTNSLTVDWDPPSGGGVTSITAYDIRHIETSADETVDANWTVIERAWTEGSGVLSYELHGLSGETRYDVQVRAVRATGSGSWSSTRTGTPAAPARVPHAPENLVASADGPTRIDLSWNAPSDDGGAAITGYRIEVSNNGSSWSDLVTNTRSSSTSHTDADLSAGITRYYRVSAINAAGRGPTSNVDWATTGAALAPDPVVETPTVSESAPAAGARFTLSATVRNQGNSRSDPTTLRYYQSSDSTITTGDTEVGTDLVSRLDGSEVGEESISLTAPSNPGTYYYGACVDGVPDESDTTNNCTTAVTVRVGAAPAPDLVVNTPTVSESAPVAGARFTLTVAVRNQGNGSSASTTLRYYQSTDAAITTSNMEVGTDSVFRLDALETEDKSISVTAPSDVGTYYYGACVDSVSDESDTTNNCSAAVTVTVGAAPAPDLVVDTPTVSESAPAAGASFTLNATVRNQGNGRSALTTLRYYRSTDSTITTSDTPAGTDSVSRLDGLETGDESISVAAPSDPGTYYYGACVESVSGESDTTNNCSAAVTVNVGAAPAPDLVVNTPTVSESSPTAGASFTLNATVRNQGSGCRVHHAALLPVHRLDDYHRGYGGGHGLSVPVSTHRRSETNRSA